MNNDVLFSDRGYTTVSLIAALVCAVPILLVSASLIKGASEISSVIQEASRRQQLAFLAEALCERLVDNLNSSSTQFGPRVYSRGVIPSRNGALRLTSNPRIEPKVTSDLIGIASAEIEKTLRVTELREAGDGFEGLLCPQFDESWVPSESVFLIGVTVTHTVELVPRQCRREGRCFRCLLHLGAGAIYAPTNQWNSRFVASVVPVSSAGFYYVDRAHQLRYAGYDGFRIIENQPLLRFVDHSGVSIGTASPHGLPWVALHLRSRRGSEHRCARVSNLARRSNVEILALRGVR